MRRVLPAGVSLLAMVIAAGGGLAAAEAPWKPMPTIACRGDRGPTWVLDAGRVVDWPSGRTVLEVGAEAVSLACDAKWVVLGLKSSRGGKVRVHRRSDTGIEALAEREIRLRFRPIALHVAAGVAVTWRQRRRGGEVALLDLEGRLPWAYRTLEAPATALGRAPKADAVLLAVGRHLRSYAAASLLSGEILPFDNPITALASRSDNTRLVVATGPRVLVVDTLDSRREGTLPVRAEINLPGPVTALALPAAAGPVASLVARPPTLVFLSPTSLAPLQSFELTRPAIQVIAEAPGQALVVFTGGDIRRFALAAPWTPSTLSPTRAMEPAEPVGPATPTTTPPALPPAGSTSELPAPPAVAPPDTAPTPLQAPPGPRTDPSVPETARRPVQPPLDLDRIPGGAIAGVLTGQASLVAEVVLQGPDDLLRVARRVVPEQIGGRFYYRTEKLTEGDYRVVPMGSGGSSLRCRPPFATVHVGPAEGARADFRILGSW